MLPSAVAVVEGGYGYGTVPFMSGQHQQWRFPCASSSSAPLCSPPAPSAETMLAGGNLLCPSAAVLGGPIQEQMSPLPQGFWRQLADSPPQQQPQHPFWFASSSSLSPMPWPQQQHPVPNIHGPMLLSQPQQQYQKQQQFLYDPSLINFVAQQQHKDPNAQELQQQQHPFLSMTPFRRPQQVVPQQQLQTAMAQPQPTIKLYPPTAACTTAEGAPKVDGKQKVDEEEEVEMKKVEEAMDVDEEEEEGDEGVGMQKDDEEMEEEEEEGEDRHNELFLHALSPTPPARQQQQFSFIHQLISQQNIDQHQQMIVCRRSPRLASPAKGTPKTQIADHQQQHGTADLMFGRMPELERQVEMEEQSTPRSSPPSEEEEDESENMHPPHLDAEDDCADDELVDQATQQQLPPLLAPLRFLEMAAAAMNARATVEQHQQQNGNLYPPCPSSSSSSSSSSWSSSSGISSADSASLNEEAMGNGHGSDDGGIDHQQGQHPKSMRMKKSRDDEVINLERRRGKRKRKDEEKDEREEMRKKRRRRRGAPRLGPRRKRRQQNQQQKKSERTMSEGGGEEEEGMEEEENAINNGCIDASPLQMALIRAPEQAVGAAKKGGRMATKRKRQPSATERNKPAPPLLQLVSNWRPIGCGCVRRLFPDSRSEFLCYEAIRHRSVPGVVIRAGDCVQVCSADSPDDLFVGRVLAIHYDPEGRALQLSLLWFYTPRQLPVPPADVELDPWELFASRHLDTVNVDSVQALVHVLTFSEYCRYRAELAFARLPPNRRPLGLKQTPRPCPRNVGNYPRRDLMPTPETAHDSVFFCRGVYSLTRKRIKSFGGPKPHKSSRGLRPCPTH